MTVLLVSLQEYWSFDGLVAFGSIHCPLPLVVRTKDDVLGWKGRINADNNEISKPIPKIKWARIIQNQRAVFHDKLQISSVRVHVLDFVLHMRHNNALGAQLRPGKHRLLCDLNIFSKLKTFRFQEESSYIVLPKLAQLSLWIT